MALKDNASETSNELSQSDVSTCDREPVNLQSSIQNTGCLIVVRKSDRVVEAISANCNEWIGQSAKDTLSRDIASVSDKLIDVMDELETVPEAEVLRKRPVHLNHRDLFLAAHHLNGKCLIELESSTDPDHIPKSNFVGDLFASIDRQSLDNVYQQVVQRIKSFTGFDRVMLYQFMEDSHGIVVAEEKAEELEPFLGLHFPAGDIPLPARRLYELNWIRAISDVNAATVPMLTSESEFDIRRDSKIDMSFVGLRAIAPIHIEYLKNMNVGASMSISIMNGTSLWGLIACHHSNSRYVPPMMRDACELTGSLLSVYLTSRRQQEALQRQVIINESMAELMTLVASHEDFSEGLEHVAPSLASMLNSQGLVWESDANLFCWGTVPNVAEIERIIKALSTQPDQSTFSTDEISTWISSGKKYANRCAGLLSVRLGRRTGGVLLFFRTPYNTVINWAGDPDKSTMDDSGRLTPRKSFALFKQEVESRSLPWTAYDLQTAKSLASSLKAMVVEQATRLIKANDELRRLNTDLDAFAYAASHDLKEPLRGMHHYVYLLEQIDGISDETFGHGVEGLKRIIKRMSDLLDGLLRFSRAGRSDLNWEAFSLREVVSQCQDLLFGGDLPENVEIRLNRDGQIRGDFTCVREILSNLISNAIKYNTSHSKTIEIGLLDCAETPLAKFVEAETRVVYVKDNGIGIDPKYHQQIFEIFRRLHDKDSFGGGSGAGLTIVRRMVERHGGLIHVESTIDQGTTFFFSLGPDE